MRCFAVALVFFIVCVCATSCAFFLLPPLEIVDVKITDTIIIEFSNEPTAISVERSFSLIEDGLVKKGTFMFQGAVVIFIPENGIISNKDYELTISGEVETEKGISLQDEYKKYFTTRLEHMPPFIAGILPADGAYVDDDIFFIKIAFSEAINEHTFAKSFKCTPSFNWIYEFNSDSTVVSIIPTEPLSVGQRYEIRVDTSLCDISDNMLLHPFLSAFTYKHDTNAPEYLLRVENDTGFSDVLMDDTVVNSVPSDVRFIMDFSEKVKIESVASLVSIVPPLQLTIVLDKESQTKATIIFTGKPEWNTRYTLTVKEGLSDIAGNKIKETRQYRFICNNEQFRPVRILKGLIDIGAIGETNPVKKFKVFSEKEAFSDISFNRIRFDPSASSLPVSSVLYYVVEFSNVASFLSVASAMNAINSSQTNNCISFSMRRLNIFSVSDSALDEIRVLLDSDSDIADIRGQCAVIQVMLEITNKDSYGLVYFNIASVLQDNLGNAMSADWSVVLNKD